MVQKFARLWIIFIKKLPKYKFLPSNKEKIIIFINEKVINIAKTLVQKELGKNPISKKTMNTMIFGIGN